jgi:diguanylate cyclase (GGDEF)-like protein
VRARLGNPLQWHTADRCLAIALIMLGSTALVLLSTLLAGGWPFLPFPAGEAPRLPLAEAIALACWLGLGAAALRSRRREDGGEVLAVLTVALFVITLAAFTLVIGPFASPGWIAFLGGSVTGYVLFARWLSITGIALYSVLVIGGAAILGGGAVPTTLAPAYAFEGLDAETVTRRGAATIGLFALTFSVIVFVVDRWRAREAGYQRLASVDALTGLTNRRHFHEIAERELPRARRYDTPLALILVDLDHFKLINDAHGHLVGDRALVHAATLLASALRETDVIARHGGEEFAVLLPMTDRDGAAEVAERCRRRLADTPLVTDGAGPIKVTASFGVTGCAGSRCGSLDDLLREADAALYRAKHAGRDRVEIATADPPALAPPRRSTP